jgi:hypothetical protein
MKSSNALAKVGVTNTQAAEEVLLWQRASLGRGFRWREGLDLEGR